jgi:hypothetical protein
MSGAIDRPTDFDIKNYSIEELINILGLGSEIPLTNEKIVTTVEKFKKRFTENKELDDDVRDNFLDFFNDINKKLLENKRDETSRNLFDEEIEVGGITRKAIPVPDRGPRKTVLYDKDIMGETRITGLQNANPDPFDYLSTDYKNPLLRNTRKQLVTIDSSFRTILLNSDCSGNTITGSNSKRMDTATEFTVNLVPPLKDVLDITFHDVSIPHDWLVFSKDYGTNYYVERKNDDTDISFVKVDNRKYSTLDSIILELNEKSNRIEFTKVGEDRVEIKNIHPTDTIIVDWYSLRVPSDSTACNVTGFGGKIDYNMGWLLGFRETSYTLAPTATAKSTATPNLFGPSYGYITIDDYNNNKPNQDLVSFTNNTASFNMPSYYVKTTMKPGANCIVESDKPSNIFCGKKYANKDLSSNLTSAQRYTIEQIRNAMINIKADRYESPNSTDVFTRVTFNKNAPFTIFTNVNKEYSKRFYFGPSNIKKLKIMLLNDKGIPINLEGSDWSFSFYATIKYQN